VPVIALQDEEDHRRPGEEYQVEDHPGDGPQEKEVDHGKDVEPIDRVAHGAAQKEGVEEDEADQGEVESKGDPDSPLELGQKEVDRKARGGDGLDQAFEEKAFVQVVDAEGVENRGAHDDGEADDQTP